MKLATRVVYGFIAIVFIFLVSQVSVYYQLSQAGQFDVFQRVEQIKQYIVFSGFILLILIAAFIAYVNKHIHKIIDKQNQDYFEITRNYEVTGQHAQENQRKFESLAASINYGMCLVDEKGKILYANAAYSQLYPNTAKWFDILDTAKHADIKKEWRTKTLKAKEYKTLQDTWVHILYSEVPDKPNTYLVLIDDVTEKRKKQYELQRANRSLKSSEKKLLAQQENIQKEIKDQTLKLQIAQLRIMSLLEQKQRFINEIAHDLRTPLTPIFGAFQLLEFTKIDKKQKELINDGMLNAKYLNDMLNEILTIAQVSSQKTVLQKVEGNLSSLTKEVLQESKLLFDKHKVKVTSKVEATDDTLMYSIRIKQVIGNLIGNAVKYTPKNPKLHIRVYQEKKRVYFSIKDNGVGIKEDYQKAIFEEFFKIDTARHDHSAGLGLSICKKIMEQHKGKIGVESHTKGSTFWFWLPVHHEHSHSRRQ